MAVNRDKPDLWKADIARSVDLFNDWFLRFAPLAFRQERVKAIEHVKEALEQTNNLTDFSPAILRYPHNSSISANDYLSAHCS